MKNPMLKREEFAVSLRKKKKAEIITAKRKRYIKTVSNAKKIYRECPLFRAEINSEGSSLDQVLEKFVPNLQI